MREHPQATTASDRRCADRRDCRQKPYEIYLIQSGDFVKIGKADDPLSRLRDLETSHHSQLVLVGCIDAGASEEKRLHRLYAKRRARGEWFRWCPELEAFAATLIPYAADTSKRKHRSRRRNSRPAAMTFRFSPEIRETIIRRSEADGMAFVDVVEASVKLLARERGLS